MTRTPDHPADPQFFERWSPRAFTDETLPEPTLMTMLEAARWAPSSFNAQPWRFVYVLRGSERWEQFVGALRPNNQAWAGRAAALVVVLSRTMATPPGQSVEAPYRTHAFDAGCAWGFLALQAHNLGWATHAMAGFEEPQMREMLQAPAVYAINAVIAIGKAGDPATLPPGLREREKVSARRPLVASVSKDVFKE